MTDLSQTVAPKSDQMNADDLIAGPRTIRITRVSGNEGNPEQPVNIFYEGDMGKPYRPCKSMRRVLIAVWGPDGSTYPGRSMTLYRDPTVAFGGMQVGGIRISHMTDLDKPMTMALTASKANRKPYTVQPLKVAADAPTFTVAQAQARARQEAAKGEDAFGRWWNTDEGKSMRGANRPILDDLRQIARDATAKASAGQSVATAPESGGDEDVIDGGPWGLPNGDDAPPPDDTHWTDSDPGNGFPGGPAWDSGVEACEAGKPARACPHAQGTQDAADWLGGWYAARRAVS